MSSVLKNISIISPLAFLLSPLLSFIGACSKLSHKANGITFVLFYGFFGYAHSFIDPRPDAYRKMVSFSSFPSSISYEDIISQYANGQISDIIERLLYVFTRTFTSDAHILLLVTGMIGGFFMYLTIGKVIQYCETDEGKPFYTILFLMIILHSPAVIGGIRFFIGLPIFLYGTFLFLFDKNNFGLIWLLISPMAHFSLVVSVALVLVLRLYSGNANWLWWCVVSLCIISVFLNATSFSNLLGSLNIEEYNQNIGNRANMYSSAKSMAHFNESLTTHLMKIQQYITRIFVLTLLIVIKRSGLKNDMKQFDYDLYRVTLAFLALGYFFVSFNVVGERYLLPGIFLLLILLYRLNANFNVSYLREILQYSFCFFVFNIGWVIFNSYVEIDLKYFVYPLPLFMII